MRPWSYINDFIKGVLSCGRSSRGCRVQIVRPEPLPEDVAEPLSDVSLDEVKRATSRFSSSLIIGYMTVPSKNTYMADDDDDFRRRIRSLLNLEHRNLVKLYGYLELNGDSIFIYEHIPFGNLRQHLNELISGRRPYERHRPKNEQMILNWAQKKFNEGNALATLDSNLPLVKSTHIALSKMLALAVLCSEFDAAKRPTMTYCADELEKIREKYTNGLLNFRHDIL